MKFYHNERVYGNLDKVQMHFQLYHLHLQPKVFYDELLNKVYYHYLLKKSKTTIIK